MQQQAEERTRRSPGLATQAAVVATGIKLVLASAAVEAMAFTLRWTCWLWWACC